MRRDAQFLCLPKSEADSSGVRWDQNKFSTFLRRRHAVAHPLSDYHPKKAFEAPIFPERSQSRAVGGGSADARRGRSLARCQAEAGRLDQGPLKDRTSQPNFSRAPLIGSCSLAL